MRSVRHCARLFGAGVFATSFFLSSTASPVAAHDEVDAHGTIRVDPAGDLASAPVVSGTFRSTEVLGLKTDNFSAVTLTLAPAGPTGGDAVTINGCDLVTDGACGSGSVSYSWTPPVPAFNGPYEARATAVHCAVVCVNPSTARVTPATFRLGVAPRAPAEVQAANGPDRTVVVSWARNPEPDMLYYAVFRKMPGAAEFTRVGGDIRQPTSGRPAFTDSGTGDGGDIAYRVLAVRKGVTGDDKSTKTSAPSAVRSVTVEAPPPTTVAAPPPGQPGAAAPPTTASAGVGANISGFLRSQPAVKPAPGPKYLDLPDVGFGGTLPFGTPPPEEELEEGPLEAELPSLPSDDSVLEEVSLTRPLVPVAAGAILLVLAAHLRILSRKLKDDPALVRPEATMTAAALPSAEATEWSEETEWSDGDEWSDADAHVASADAASDEVFDHAASDVFDDRASLTGAAYDSEWGEFEPPAIVDSSAGGGSLLAPESIAHYTEAAAPYYEGVPTSEPEPEPEPEGEADPELGAAQEPAPEPRSTAVWRSSDFADDFLDEGLFDDDAAEPGGPAAQVDDQPPAGPEAPPAAGDVPEEDLWEEEMIWEVVSPSR